MNITPIERAKARRHYLTAMRRPRCGTCEHMQEEAPRGNNDARGLMRCSLEGFYTTAYAVCDGFARKGVAA